MRLELYLEWECLAGRWLHNMDPQWQQPSPLGEGSVKIPYIHWGACSPIVLMGIVLTNQHTTIEKSLLNSECNLKLGYMHVDHEGCCKYSHLLLTFIIAINVCPILLEFEPRHPITWCLYITISICMPSSLAQLYLSSDSKRTGPCSNFASWTE